MAFLKDRHTGKEYSLDRRVTNIGRDRDNHIIFSSRLVSRHHARVVKGLLGYYIEDLESTGGTFVNDERIKKKTRLHHGDIIKIARVRDTERPKTTRASTGDTTRVVASGASFLDAEGFRVGAELVFVR